MKKLITILALMAFSLSITAQTKSKRGDVNGDGDVSIADVALLVSYIINGGNISSVADVNGDGDVTITDVTNVVGIIIHGDNSQPQDDKLCPDDNHPHMIDLGLPSGTLWACCNVDATAPEGTGGYYAWGESQTKSSYSYSNYLYFDRSDYSYLDLGDISGTDYDVAQKVMGAPWRMPTIDQFAELASNCTFTWATENDIVGGRFTSSNGKSIFLPAAGGYRGTKLSNLNSYGLYWSDTQYEDLEGRAYPFIFHENSFADEEFMLYDDYYEDTYFPREYGYQVRAVTMGEPVVHLELATADLTLEAGNMETVEITSGNGSYTVTTSNDAVATAVIDGSSVKVTAVGEGTAIITVTDTQSNETATIEVTVGEVPVSICPDSNHPHVIDLGLPSGTKWACCNVDPIPSKQNPTNYGGYYAWGETETKTQYGWGNYAHCDGTYNSLHDIGNDICGTEYDVAHVKWEGNWRMPSQAQRDELFSNTTYTWTTVDGISGGLFTSTNGNSIFLPASGFYDGSGLEYRAESGFYWTGTLGTGKVYNPSNFGFYDNVAYMNDEYVFSSDGASIRPVLVEVTLEPIALASTTLSMTVGDEPQTVAITSGNGSYTVSTSNDAVATAVIDGSSVKVTAVGAGTATITVTDTQSNETATIEVTVEAPVSLCPDDNHPHYIDLGLPSGILWACCNVDTDHPESQSPTNDGGYYAWGETETKTTYDWSTYIHCDDGDAETCHFIGYNISGTEYDVAHVKWGGNWVMPSDEQFDELLENCSYAWKTINNVTGGLFTSSNGNSIFLPAAGYRRDADLSVYGTRGYYWSDTRDWSYSSYVLYFNNEEAFLSDDFDNCIGRPIRPISTSVPVLPLQLSSTSETIEVNNQAVVQITSGNGSYKVYTSDSSVATATIDGTSVIITAVGAGTTYITVHDTQSNEMTAIVVTVEEAGYPSLALSGNTITTILGEEATVEIISGSGDYDISSFVFNGSNGMTYYGISDEVNAVIEGSLVKFTSSVVGTGSFKIIDSNTGEAVTIEVTVDHAFRLSDSVLNLDLEDNFDWGVHIYGGSGEYTVESSDENVATVGDVYVYEYVYEDEGDFTVYAVGHGTATITVTDTRTGEQITLEVKVTVPLEFSETEVSLYAIYDYASVRIRNGSGSYVAVSSDENVATASVRNNDIEIRSFLEEGTVTITVTDTQTGQTGTITVTVKKPDPIVLSSSSLSLAVGRTETVEISGGSGEFDVYSSDDEVATAELDGNSVIVTAVGVGTTTIDVYDMNSSVEATIEVTVSAAPTSYLTCPDNNHPHVIDLGLPSGTKWACCNVGADHPENQSPTNYGGYYAWGETETKTTYDWSTYIHCDGSEETCHDLGSDISGTQYDVAHVKWGGNWVMPTDEQMTELRTNCSSEWTTMNDVNGHKFTGSNGGSIFLPAAGHRSYDYHEEAGSFGFYWSSTLGPSGSYGPYRLLLNSSGTNGSGYWYREDGHTVRPVCNENDDEPSPRSDEPL